MNYYYSMFLVFILAIFGSQIQVSTSAVDFFYLLLQWPGSQCNTKQGCCYDPTVSRKPTNDFIIAGLQPFYFNGTFPKYCDSKNHFDFSNVVDLKKSLSENWPNLSCPHSGGKKLWAEEWRKYGTCSESVFSQHQYFSAALNLKKKANLLNVLTAAGIKPNGKSSSGTYEVGSISDAIVRGGLNLPGIGCNVDKNGKSQLNIVLLCANSQASSIVECPGIPTNLGHCTNSVNFPSL